MPDEEVVLRAQRGEASASEYLIRMFTPLVSGRARPYFLLGADKDDLHQEGMIGLCKAIRDYRPDRAAHFRAFADLCVSRQLVSAVKSCTRRKHDPLNGSYSLNALAGNEDAWAEQTCASKNPEQMAIRRLLPKTLRTIIRDQLSPLERNVLRLYLDGNTYREIGASLECPTKTIDNALQRVKKKFEQVWAE